MIWKTTTIRSTNSLNYCKNSFIFNYLKIFFVLCTTEPIRVEFYRAQSRCFIQKKKVSFTKLHCHEKVHKQNSRTFLIFKLFSVFVNFKFWIITFCLKFCGNYGNRTKICPKNIAIFRMQEIPSGCLKISTLRWNLFP